MKGNFEEIYKREYNKVYNLCYRMCGDRYVAEDLAGDIFLKLHTQFYSLKADSISSYIYKMAVNHCRDYNRRRGRWRNILKSLTYMVRRWGDVERGVVDWCVGEEILSKMSFKNRAILVLKEYLGLSYREIADILDTTPNVVGVMLHRAREKAIKIAKEGGYMDEV